MLMIKNMIKKISANIIRIESPNISNVYNKYEILSLRMSIVLLTANSHGHISRYYEGLAIPQNRVSSHIIVSYSSYATLLKQ